MKEMITKVVCYAELNCSIYLIRLANACADVVYKPDAFPGAIWSDERAGGNCKVFSNGKLVVNGRSRSVCETETRLREYATPLRENGMVYYRDQYKNWLQCRPLTN